MKPNLVEARYFATYYYASVIRDILHDPMANLHIREEFVCDDSWLGQIAPFRRRSAFHEFIWFAIDRIVSDEVAAVKLDTAQDQFANLQDLPEAMDDLRPAELPVNTALRYYDIEHESFEDWLISNGKT